MGSSHKSPLKSKKKKKSGLKKKFLRPRRDVVWGAVRRCEQCWTAAAMFSITVAAFSLLRKSCRERENGEGCSWMNAVNRAKNKCMKNMLCGASNRKQLVVRATVGSGDKGDKEMRKNSGDRWREEQIGKSCMSESHLSSPIAPSPKPQRNFPPFLITDCTPWSQPSSILPFDSCAVCAI